ncbi:hypothetical protein AAHC03_026126 [Spirometra sp. Aus1]
MASRPSANHSVHFAALPPRTTLTAMMTTLLQTSVTPFHIPPPAEFLRLVSHFKSSRTRLANGNIRTTQPTNFSPFCGPPEEVPAMRSLNGFIDSNNLRYSETPDQHQQMEDVGVGAHFLHGHLRDTPLSQRKSGPQGQPSPKASDSGLRKGTSLTL